MQHGHFYRILATATNELGVPADEPCPSPLVIVDTTPPSMGQVYMLQWQADAELEVPPTPTFQYR